MLKRQKLRGGVLPAVLPAIDSNAQGMLPFTMVDAVPGGYAMSLWGFWVGSASFIALHRQLQKHISKVNPRAYTPAALCSMLVRLESNKKLVPSSLTYAIGPPYTPDNFKADAFCQYLAGDFSTKEAQAYKDRHQDMWGVTDGQHFAIAAAIKLLLEPSRFEHLASVPIKVVFCKNEAEAIKVSLFFTVFPPCVLWRDSGSIDGTHFSIVRAAFLSSF